MIREFHFLGTNHIHFSVKESEKPQTIELKVDNRVVKLTREQWRDVCNIASDYSPNFKWQYDCPEVSEDSSV